MVILAYKQRPAARLGIKEPHDMDIAKSNTKGKEWTIPRDWVEHV
jgi:hypothetical protein